MPLEGFTALLPAPVYLPVIWWVVEEYFPVKVKVALPAVSITLMVTASLEVILPVKSPVLSTVVLVKVPAQDAFGGFAGDVEYEIANAVNGFGFGADAGEFGDDIGDGGFGFGGRMKGGGKQLAMFKGFDVQHGKQFIAIGSEKEWRNSNRFTERGLAAVFDWSPRGRSA